MQHAHRPQPQPQPHPVYMYMHGVVSNRRHQGMPAKLEGPAAPRLLAVPRFLAAACLNTDLPCRHGTLPPPLFHAATPLHVGGPLEARCCCNDGWGWWARVGHFKSVMRHPAAAVAVAAVGAGGRPYPEARSTCLAWQQLPLPLPGPLSALEPHLPALSGLVRSLARCLRPLRAPASASAARCPRPPTQPLHLATHGAGRPQILIIILDTTGAAVFLPLCLACRTGSRTLGLDLLGCRGGRQRGGDGGDGQTTHTSYTMHTPLCAHACMHAWGQAQPLSLRGIHGPRQRVSY